MPYDFLNASMPIQKSPKNSFSNDFQKNLDMEFKTSTDWYTIKEEFPTMSKNFVDIDVRVNHAINTRTGQHLGDDYKIILFQNLDHVSNVGYMYLFDDNYWIVINSEGIKNLAASSVVKRCNNVLKWIDPETGAILTSPCSINYDIKQNRDYSTAGSSLVLPSGFIEVVTQFNETTNKIQPSQRFLFGNTDNWVGYKIMGGGIDNYNNLKTSDNSSTGLLKLTMTVGQSNPTTDDFVNGVADAFEDIYTIKINKNSISIENGQTFSLSAEVKINGIIFDKSVAWSSDNLLVARVDSSGLVTTISPGMATIKCEIDGNSSVYDECLISVISSPSNNYEIILDPSTNSILEGSVEIYSVYLWLNDVVQSDTFTITVDISNTVPISKFSYNVIDGNHFSITNISRYLNSSLKIKIESGIHTEIVEYWLRGAW